MWHVEKCIDIKQPPEVVYSYLSYFQHVPEWDTSVLSARRISSGKPVAGSRFQLILLFGWNRIPIFYEIVAMKPSIELVLIGRALNFTAVDHIRLQKIPLGTRLNYIAEVAFDRPHGKLIDRLMKALFRRNASRAINRLKSVLSGHPHAPRLTVLTRMADQAIVPGLAGFTRAGYFLARNHRPVASALYAGRTMLLTGATSGIGKAAARRLFSKGAHLVVVGRNADKLAQLRRELVDIGGDGTIDTEMADLSLLADIRALAARIDRRFGKIDVLINNAGALFNRCRLTAEGLEMTLATNLAGPYLLTRLLLPKLRAAKGGRIINVASGGMYTQGLRGGALPSCRDAYDGPAAYAQAKRGLVMLTGIWGRELAPLGISVHAMHPGWVDTPGLEKALPAFHRQLSAWLRTPDQGADTIVWLAAAPDAARAPGHFWLDRRIHPIHVFTRTRDFSRDRRALVDALDGLTGRASTR